MKQDIRTIDDLLKENRQLKSELEIETALEKVRAIALSMKEPADMPEVCKIIARQLDKLGVKEIRNVQTAIFYESKGTYMNYEYYAKHDKTVITETSYTNHKIHQAFADKMLKGPGEVSVTHIPGSELKDWIAYQKTTNVFIDTFLEKAASLNYYWHSLGPVALGISTYIPLKDDELNLFKRFLNVFELAYTRYMDIEQAIVQAKEAKIELGLERVRARAMAMQHSDELAELVATLFRELNQLDFSLASCIIWIHSPAYKSNVLWIASDTMNKPARPLQVRPFYPDFFTSIIEAWKAKDPKWIFSLSGTEKKKFEKLFFEEYPELPEALKKPVSSNKQIVFSASFNNFGALEIVATEPLSAEKFEILHRFGKVFDSSYTRFNDLKKAEAQAREAQIQLALERVRARTMAMQKSDELPETSHILFEQMKELGEPVEQLTIGIVHEENNVIEISATLHGDTLKKIYLHSIDEPYMMIKVYKAWKTQQKTLIVELKGDELNSYNKYRNKLTNSEMFPTNLGDEHRRIVYAAFFSKGMLALGANEPRPPQSLQLLERFASAFDLTYTRFLDLQKAEAQAREAQIEAALERVRGRTMAMHKSEELLEVINTVSEQLEHLQFRFHNVSFVINNREYDLDYWLSSPGQSHPFRIHVPYLDNPIITRFRDARNKGISFFADVLTREENFHWIKHMLENSVLKNIPDSDKQYLMSRQGFARSVVLTNHITLVIGNYASTSYSDEQNAILKRFANVFEQSYTRFLDLQKAEEQAREAQIEAALERVRSRSMGMQKSEELKEVIKLVYQQLIHLKINLDHAGFVVDYKPKGNWTFWIADERDIPSKITHPYFESVWANQFDEAKEKGIDFFATNLSFEEKNKFYNELLSYVPGLPQASKDFYLSCPGLAATTVLFDNVGLYIENFSGIPYTDEENNTLMRFGKVFQQTYTRFLDLQKAEAQAREAKIEAALERVRSKAMSMQKSEDLANAVGIAFEELDKLNPGMMRCGIAILNKEKQSGQVWTTTKSDNNTVVQVSGDQSMDIHPLLQGAFQAWLSQETDYNYVLKGDDLNNYYKTLIDGDFRLPGSQSLVAGTEGLVQYYYTAVFSSGGLFAFRETEFPEEARMVLRRFADVFNLTYTRFNDLQKAETQAKESELEKKRSEDLLLNILPKEIANELKQFGKSYARKHEQVSILFTDIKGFSTISENLSAEELVNQLDECFRAFDHIVGKHGLEKIKTIGDAYICACGLPNPDPDNAVKTVKAAIDMLDFAKGFAMTKIIQDLPGFEFRFGIHTGPVITGVVGLKKFTYDIWGDAVNMAARMEQHGEAGKINISGNTYQLVKDKFLCTYRGKIAAKNKGEVDMYFVEKASN